MLFVTFITMHTTKLNARLITSQNNRNSLIFNIFKITHVNVLRRHSLAPSIDATNKILGGRVPHSSQSSKIPSRKIILVNKYKHSVQDYMLHKKQQLKQ